MRTPTLWRKRRGRGGKYTGNFYVSIKGRDINLGTQDGNEATKRLAEALRGRRTWPDDLDEAAAAVDGPPPEPPPAAAAVLPPAPASSAPPDPPRPPVQPDQVLPPLLPPMSSDEARAEAEATNAAAAAGSEDGGQADAGGGIPFGSEALDNMIENGALLLVDWQLQLQAAVIRRRLKKEPGQIPEESPARKMAADAWKEQLRRWLPSTADLLPPWALALAIPALCIPMQVMTATDLPKENGQEQPVAAAA
ncbi:MAG TPA: hypothetical protein VEB22_11225 [Phycisphaerales bacterium]|nr:hypothetical protein [Phycisphaerales bacterium]